MTTVRVAASCRALLNQADELWPERSRASDGTIGDARHRSRRSDHNPDPAGWVHAADLTHDPAHGLDVHAWAREVARRGDQRVKYLISDGQIWNPLATAWATYGRLRDEGHDRLQAAAMALPGWRPYAGDNQHRVHVHVSVQATDAARADTSPWFDPAPQEDDDMAFRYKIGEQIWTTDLVWRQHWESPGPGLGLVLAHTRDLGTVPKDFHDSLVDIAETAAKARDAVNYAVDAQMRLAELARRLDVAIARLESPGGG